MFRIQVLTVAYTQTRKTKKTEWIHVCCFIHLKSSPVCICQYPRKRKDNKQALSTPLHITVDGTIIFLIFLLLCDFSREGDQLKIAGSWRWGRSSWRSTGFPSGAASTGTLPGSLPKRSRPKRRTTWTSWSRTSTWLYSCRLLKDRTWGTVVY